MERTGPVLHGVDKPFLILTLLLMGLGLVCLFSASYASAYAYQDQDSTYFVVRQAIFGVGGLLVMFGLAYHDYHWLKWAGYLILLLSLGLLATRFAVPSVWSTINDATRWINVAGLITFQPSELAKVGVIGAFASIASSMGARKMKRWWVIFVPFGLLLGATVGLIYSQPHFSAIVIIAVIGVAIMVVGGANLLVGGATVGVAGTALVWLMTQKGHSSTRLKVWLDPFSDFLGAGWQASQSFIAIGSGGLWGLGLGQGRQKHLFLPEPANDFIFSVICEELGFVGATLIILCFAALVWRGFYIARHASDRFGALLVVGVTMQIAVQTIINLCVVCGLAPVTGASLPFFSAGGTALFLLLCEVGVVLSVSRQMKDTEDQ